MKKFNRMFPALWVASVLVAVSLITAQTGAAATEGDAGKPSTIAVLPFTMHASEDVSHIQQGVVHMLHSRLAWPDQVRVVPRREVDAILTYLAGQNRKDLIRKVADQTGSDYILDGSITQLAGSFSIDAMVYDIANQQYMAFFEQSGDSDELIDKVSRIAAGINKQVFDRTTTAWERIEQERQAQINELRRRHPEHLMHNPQWQKEDTSPGWKIWKYLF